MLPVRLIPQQLRGPPGLPRGPFPLDMTSKCQHHALMYILFRRQILNLTHLACTVMQPTVIYSDGGYISQCRHVYNFSTYLYLHLTV